MPDLDILHIYARQGGQKITLGSDAHAPEDIGAGFEYALSLVEQFPQFQLGYVEQRHFVPLVEKIEHG
jgi:histidinol-phosphatase (PHP family)